MGKLRRMNDVRWILDREDPMEDLENAMKMYRYEDGYNLWNSQPKINLCEFYVLRETPKGYWLADEYGYDIKKWVSNYGMKRYAFPTKLEALKSYNARKYRHYSILKQNLKSTEFRWKESSHLLEKMQGDSDVKSSGSEINTQG